jgi:hypothetical protein
MNVATVKPNMAMPMMTSTMDAAMAGGAELSDVPDSLRGEVIVGIGVDKAEEEKLTKEIRDRAVGRESGQSCGSDLGCLASGSYGSRQEEAQRLGRILRPKEHASHFYTLVSKGTVEQTFGSNRQLFLVEQGYRYQIRYF